MKRNQVNSILVNQTKRRATVFAYICVIVIVFSLACASFLEYIDRNESQYVSYDETSNIDYQVYYKENDFFDDKYLEADKQYIASLIDKINVEFNYNISLEDVDVEYKYTYRVEANVIVRDKDSKNLFYDKAEVLVKEKEENISLKEVSLTEKLVINYASYNNKIKELVNVYDLKNSESFLNVNMYINVVGSCEDFDEKQEPEKVITLAIPLSEDTLSINFIDNTVNSNNSVIKCNATYASSVVFMVVGIVLAILDVVLVVLVIRYEYKTRTAESIYEKELKKILNNYGSSIQVLGNEFVVDGYQVLKIESFNDILEISDKLRKPILMKENKEKTGAYFIIPSDTKLLYVYRLKVSDIEKEINEKNNNI